MDLAKSPQDRPRAPQDPSRSPQDRPGPPQDRPRSPQERPRPPQDRPRSPQEHPRPPQDPTQKSQRTKSTQNTCCSAGWRQVVGTTILCCDMYLPSRHTSPPQVSHLYIFDRKVWASGREEHLMLCKCFCLNRQAGESIGLKFFGSSRATGV